MTKKKKETVRRLIEEGKNFSFANNRKMSQYNGEYFSEATDELLSWISKVENFISSNFSNTSGPYKMMESVDKKKLTGYYESEFSTELTKVKGAIKSCLDLQTNSDRKYDAITSLIKNIYFWTVIVIVASGAYKLGYDNGNSKVYNTKFELNKIIGKQNSEIQQLKKKILLLENQQKN